MLWTARIPLPLTFVEVGAQALGLVEMLTDIAKPAPYILVGNTGGVGLNHKSNHWCRSAAVVTLGKCVDAMFKTGWGTVGVNDGRLMWNGLFDIKGNWTTPHSKHRTGTEVDISFNNPNEIVEEQKKETYAELRSANTTAFSIQTLWQAHRRGACRAR